MVADYLYVHKKILPDYLEKVIRARELLEGKEAATVTEAAERVGISRNTYYRYKDYVFRPKEMTTSHQAVFSILLSDEPGALASVITCITNQGASILTISQAIPLQHQASVLMSLDLSQMEASLEKLTADLKRLKVVKNLQLAGIE
ncbi:Chorismate mutase [Lactobacillus equicursoris DSM 19284 = JCM 14600 = CIP 110162]|nr:Chorismate mutase [Lactobacillus equicursoris DSM 19284 = JCM 14600 = CIP 110162]